MIFEPTFGLLLATAFVAKLLQLLSHSTSNKPSNPQFWPASCQVESYSYHERVAPAELQLPTAKKVRYEVVVNSQSHAGKTQSNSSASSLATRHAVIFEFESPVASLFLHCRWKLTHWPSFGSAGCLWDTRQWPCSA